MAVNKKALDDLVVALLMFGVGAWVYSELSALQHGAVQSVKVWAPIAALYNHFGFWPSVLLLPLFGLIFLGMAVVKFAKVQADA